MTDCIFCKIVAGEIPSVKIWENDQYIAIFDALPVCKGQTLVMPKRHYDSNIFTLDDAFYSELMLAAKEVALLLKKGLGIEKVGMVVEGLQVSHAHVKLYPFRSSVGFEGGVTGHIFADINELQQLAEKLKN